MAHSAEEFGGETVGEFVMSVIEAVGTGSGSSGRGNSRNKTRNVSPYPILHSRSSPTSLKSPSSQELVEDTLGSLATLLSVSTSRVYVQGTNGGIKAVGRTRGKLHTTGRKDNAPRKNTLRRKKSSLTALSPEDLGRVSKSPLQFDALSPSPPSVVVTYPSSSSASSPKEKDFNDKGEKITASSPKSDDHPSTFHSRKPISSDSSNSSNGNNNHSNKQESEIKIGSANNRTNGGSGTTILKEITKKVVGQRSPNYTDSKDNPEPLQLLHNNSSNTSSDGVTNSPKDESHQNINNNTTHQSSGNSDLRVIATDTPSEIEKNCYADDVDKERRQELDNHDDRCHGHMSVHHYHHHSHHHHYHYYENSGQQKSHRGHPHNHPSFSTNNNNQHASDEDEDDDQHNHDQQQQQQQNDTVGEDINGSAGLIPQRQQNHLHNHHAKMIKSDVYSSAPAEQPPKSPPPSHEHYRLDDISFYRKFSATSPPPNFANRHRRTKSSLEWAAAETELNVLISNRIGGGGLCSKIKRHKSRSTPIRLDIIGYDSKHSSQPAPPPTSPSALLPDTPDFFGYGCKCGGCLFCCNEISCNCCCDECCCARQYSHVSPSFENGKDTDIDKIDKKNSGNDKKGRGDMQERKTSSHLKQRSRSMNSILSHSNHNNKDVSLDEDDEINDPDSFIDAHLLRHLELFDSDFGDDDEDDNKNRDDLNLSANNSDHGEEEIDDDTGQVHLVSINGKETGASEHDRKEDTNIDDKNSTTSLVVVGNVRGDSGTSTTAAELISPGRSTNIILVRKTPTRSSVHRNRGDRRRNSSGEGTSLRRSSSNASTLRTANGEIRSSPIVPLSGNSTYETSNSGGGAFLVEEQTRRSAVMTVTVDSMSLFLDAVHLQMNQG